MAGDAAVLYEAPLAIGGRLRPGVAGEWFDSFEPATGRRLGRVALASEADVADAVEAAAAAQPAWAALPDLDRAARLLALAEALTARTADIADLEARDTGNTIQRLHQDVRMAAESLRYFAGLIPAITGETTRSTPEHLHLSLREPYAVAARIVPFNHPFMFAAARIAAPLAAGCGVVVKTPEQSPLSSRLLAEACHEVLPPGIVNIVHGPGDPTGSALVRHPKVKRIGFTGSVPTGRLIQRIAAEAGVKHLSLELGGKNPMILFPDVAPARAAEIAVRGMNFAWAGQSCGSTSRVLVHDSIYDEVVARIAEAVEALRLGDPLDPASQMGPVNSAAHLRRVEAHIADAVADGARLVAGGKRPEGAAFAGGYWIRPTVFADVTPQMRLGQEEVFGPVMAIMRWRDEAEALEIANSTRFGLTASIWTGQLDRALRFARAVESGYVWINGSSAHFQGMPFAGRKESGIGSEEGLEELLSYTQTRAVNILLGADLGG